MVVEQLDVARLQVGLHAQRVAGGQLVEKLHRLQLRRRQAGHLRVPLAEEEVVVAVVGGQVALCTKKGCESNRHSCMQE